ncbi:MAG: ABC transporter permease [Mesorhizobium sp.]|nr:MAG: ABC transporter permease [Mesorhizobium sp.]
MTSSPARLLGLRTILVLVFAFLYIPIAVLVALSFNAGGLPTAWSGFSLKWYASLAGNAAILQAALNTLIVALVSTAIATLLGTLLAIGIEMRRQYGKGLDALIFAPMIIPDIVLAIALLSFFSMLDVTMGLHTIILAHVVFNLAFVCSVVRARLKSFDWSIVEASADLGASALTTFRRVTLPVILPAGRASTTLPMQIYSMIRFGITPEINALATIVMAVSITALTLSQRLNRGVIGQ